MSVYHARNSLAILQRRPDDILRPKLRFYVDVKSRSRFYITKNLDRDFTHLSEILRRYLIIDYKVVSKRKLTKCSEHLLVYMDHQCTEFHNDSWNIDGVINKSARRKCTASFL